MNNSNESKPKLYRSRVSGKPLTIHGARIAVVSKEDLASHEMFRGSVRKADLNNPSDLESVKTINIHFWHCLEQDVFGRTYNVLDCENYLAIPEADESGADDPECMGISGNAAITEEAEGFLHIVVFNVWHSWHGRKVGRAMLEVIINEARNRGYQCIKLGTTNDNLPALYFYQRAGFVIENIVPLDSYGKCAGSPRGFAGIPITHEIQLRLDV